MSRPARRSATALACAFLGASALAAVPGGAVLQAVVAYDGAAPSVAGVQVVGSFSTLRMAVVRGNAPALARLSVAPGVRSVSPDDAVQLSGHDNGSDGEPVLASQGLGGEAGRDGAGSGVRVAVIDTGVSDTAALNRSSGRLVDAADTSHLGEVRTGGTYTDGYGHGTFMAGIIGGSDAAGSGGRNLGVAPGATILVVRVAKQNGSTSLSRVLGGLDWVAAHPDRVDVANLSLSHSRPQRAYGPDPLTDAVEAVRDAGVTVVVSAGNKRGTVGDPGFDPQVLTVGAADLGTGRVAAFSGSDSVYGVQKPDVVASGVDVLGLLPLDSVIAEAPGTKQLASGLYHGTGTSQATAIVSGLAAVFLDAHPSASATDVKAALRCNARDLHGKRDGAGLVRTPTEPCSAQDAAALEGPGGVGPDANAWASTSWAANSWAANSWAANSWAANSWAANSWAANSWAANSWAANSWAANSWAANSWAANSWAANSWAADGWGAEG